MWWNGGVINPGVTLYYESDRGKCVNRNAKVGSFGGIFFSKEKGKLVENPLARDQSVRIKENVVKQEETKRFFFFKS